jgi:hypothetical protein
MEQLRKRKIIRLPNLLEILEMKCIRTFECSFFYIFLYTIINIKNNYIKKIYYILYKTPLKPLTHTHTLYFKCKQFIFLTPIHAHPLLEFQVRSAPITKDMVAPVASLLAGPTEAYLSKAKSMADGQADQALAEWSAGLFISKT